jgi:hypothetical protein
MLLAFIVDAVGVYVVIVDAVGVYAVGVYAVGVYAVGINYCSILLLLQDSYCNCRC